MFVKQVRSTIGVQRWVRDERWARFITIQRRRQDSLVALFARPATWIAMPATTCQSLKERRLLIWEFCPIFAAVLKSGREFSFFFFFLGGEVSEPWGAGCFRRMMMIAELDAGA